MIPNGLLRTGVRDLVRRPLHTGLMVLGMALGVSVVVAIDIANVAARRGFARSTAAVAGARHPPGAWRLPGSPPGLPQAACRPRLEAERARGGGSCDRGRAAIEGLDRPTETVTLKGPLGGYVGVRVSDSANLPLLRIGDTVLVTYTEALAISLEKLAKPAIQIQ